MRRREKEKEIERERGRERLACYYLSPFPLSIICRLGILTFILCFLLSYHSIFCSYNYKSVLSYLSFFPSHFLTHSIFIATLLSLFILFCSLLFYSLLLSFILFYSCILLYCLSFFYSTLFYSFVFLFLLFYSLQLSFILLYCLSFSFIQLSFILLNSFSFSFILFYSLLFFCMIFPPLSNSLPLCLIGSLQKVDATYLSPHVNMAARLETASRQYGMYVHANLETPSTTHDPTFLPSFSPWLFFFL